MEFRVLEEGKIVSYYINLGRCNGKAILFRLLKEYYKMDKRYYSFDQITRMFKDYINTHDVSGMSTSDILKEILFKEENKDGSGKERERQERN